jgi:hypothetical protein
VAVPAAVFTVPAAQVPTGAQEVELTVELKVSAGQTVQTASLSASPTVLTNEPAAQLVQSPQVAALLVALN